MHLFHKLNFMNSVSNNMDHSSISVPVSLFVHCYFLRLVNCGNTFSFKAYAECASLAQPNHGAPLLMQLHGFPQGLPTVFTAPSQLTWGVEQTKLEYHRISNNSYTPLFRKKMQIFAL